MEVCLEGGKPFHHLAVVSLVLSGSLCPEGTEGRLLGMGKFGVEMGVVWEVKPLHRLRRSPSPFRGGFWGWGGFGVEVRVGLDGGTPPPPGGGPPRTERSPLSLRDISPPRGESPLSGEALGAVKSVAEFVAPERAPEGRVLC